MKLWDKGHDVDKAIETFTVGNDHLLDKQLVYWDAVASIAHAKGLHKIDILTTEEKDALVMTLEDIKNMAVSGEFEITQEDEDCHTAIENYLTAELGDVGKKIHTGRSRNDQVLAALKLYMKDALQKTDETVQKLIETLQKLSHKYPYPLPGYTHMRKAMPSSVKLWAGSFIHSLQDDLLLIKAAEEFIDSCPLGSAAGYGSPFDLDRAFVAKELGFSRVQQELSSQNTRGKNEMIVLQAMMSIMTDLNKLATDIILWSMPAFGFFELPDKMTTGSSIMPQKKNPDVLELVRAKTHIIHALHTQVSTMILNLPSGYNRDFQLTKEPLVKGIDITMSCLEMMKYVIEGLVVCEESCEAAMTKELYATERAYELVKQGVPFREAYKRIKDKH